MKGLKDTLANLAGLRTRFERALSTAGSQAASGGETKQLREVGGFGHNPGNLRMFTHMRRNLTNNCPLVVALHGCTQTAATYDHGSGWSQFAYEYGFALLLPQQQRTNNPNACFNWFLPQDTRRDSGEALSIREMIDRMIEEHSIDRRRIYIVGLSAGGAMASAMLASYPELFAGGAVIAGLPHGSAANVQQAFEAMAKPRDRAPSELGELVRAASEHRGPWPKLSLWHGSADAVVNSANMEESLKQWTNIHGLSLRPRIEHELAGHSRRLWRTDDEEDVIEAITIRNMNHGVPIATNTGRASYGNVSPYHFDVGIGSSEHIVKFWGIADKLAAVERRQDLLVVTPTAAQTADAPRLVARQALATDGTSSDPSAIIAAALTKAGVLRENDTDTTAAGNARRLIRKTLQSVGVLRR